MLGTNREGAEETSRDIKTSRDIAKHQTLRSEQSSFGHEGTRHQMLAKAVVTSVAGKSSFGHKGTRHL